MNLSGKVLRDMEFHTRSAMNSEVCGFVYRNDYVPLTNRSSSPERFEADPSEIAKMLNRNGEPMAVFHSHPSGNLELSPSDRKSWYYHNSTILLGTIRGRHFVIKSFLYGHEGD